MSSPNQALGNGIEEARQKPRSPEATFRSKVSNHLGLNRESERERRPVYTNWSATDAIHAQFVAGMGFEKDIEVRISFRVTPGG